MEFCFTGLDNGKAYERPSTTFLQPFMSPANNHHVATGRIYYPQLISRHQKRDGYYPSLNSMFVPTDDRTPDLPMSKIRIRIGACARINTVPIQSIRRSRVTGGPKSTTGHRSQGPATKSPGQSKNWVLFFPQKSIFLLLTSFEQLKN